MIDLHEGVAALFDEAAGAGRKRWLPDLPARRWEPRLDSEEFSADWLAAENARLSELRARRIEDQRAAKPRRVQVRRTRSPLTHEQKLARREYLRAHRKKVNASIRALRAQHAHPSSVVDWKMIETVAKEKRHAD
jgi:hypothetical protein